MRGFTDEALLLFSKLDVYESGSRQYKCNYQLAVDNLLDYLADMGISHACLISDQSAPRLSLREPHWFDTGAREDMFFLHNFTYVPEYPSTPLDSVLISTLRKKYPLTRGMTIPEQAKVVGNRITYAEKALIGTFKFVVVFGEQFRVKSAEEDGRAILHVHEKTFQPSMVLSGNPVPINIFLQRSYANLCLTEWGKYRG